MLVISNNVDNKSKRKNDQANPNCHFVTDRFLFATEQLSQDVKTTFYLNEYFRLTISNVGTRSKW